jgi:hypothetical protein
MTIVTFVSLAGLGRPNTSILKLFHGRIGEFGPWAIVTNYKHKDGLLTSRTGRDILEASNRARRPIYHQGISGRRWSLLGFSTGTSLETVPFGKLSVSCAYWFADSKTIDGESVVNVRCVRKEPETGGRKKIECTWN